MLSLANWRIDIVASFERNVTMLHLWKPLNGIFARLNRMLYAAMRHDMDCQLVDPAALQVLRQHS
jgi:hypothetical protein